MSRIHRRYGTIVSSFPTPQPDWMVVYWLFSAQALGRSRLLLVELGRADKARNFLLNNHPHTLVSCSRNPGSWRRVLARRYSGKRGRGSVGWKISRSVFAAESLSATAI